MSLNKKQKQFVNNLLDGKNYGNAAVAAGYNYDYGNQLVHKPNIKEALMEKLGKLGITEEYMAQKMKDGLEAQTVPQKEGGSRYDDQFIRRQWMELLLKIRGDFAPEKIESSHKTITIAIDGAMIRALADSGAISPIEMGLLEHEPVREGLTAGPVTEAEVILGEEQ